MDFQLHNWKGDYYVHLLLDKIMVPNYSIVITRSQNVWFVDNSVK